MHWPTSLHELITQIPTQTRKLQGLDSNAMTPSSQPIQAQIAALHQPISAKTPPVLTPGHVKVEPQCQTRAAAAVKQEPVKQEPLASPPTIKPEPTEFCAPVKCEPLPQLQLPSIKTEPTEPLMRVKVEPVHIKAEPCA